jgi:hypothetical protein
MGSDQIICLLKDQSSSRTLTALLKDQSSNRTLTALHQEGAEIVIHV